MKLQILCHCGLPAPSTSALRFTRETLAVSMTPVLRFHSATLSSRVKFSAFQLRDLRTVGARAYRDHARAAIGMFNAADDSRGFDPMNRPRRSPRQGPAAANLEKKIQDALNESRILVLGVQVLLSFQYTSVLENAFVKLPFVSQALELITLALLLLTFGLLVSPAPYHLLVWRSEDSE